MRAKPLLGGHYETLDAKRRKGARNPYRLVVLIARGEEMIDKLVPARRLRPHLLEEDAERDHAKAVKP